MKEGNEEARQTEGDNGGTRRGWRREGRGRSSQIGRVGRQGVGARRTEVGKGNGGREERERTDGEGVEGCATEKEGGRKERGGERCR